MNLRNKKKQATKEKIIAVANALFKEKGYEKTTTDEIAQKAGIASGTIFNYFPSKAEIFIESLTEDFSDEVNHTPFELDSTLPIDEIMFNFIYTRLFKYLKISKKIQRQLFSISITAIKSKPAVLRRMISLDFMLVDEIIEVLNKLKEKNVLSQDYESNAAAEIIYSMLAFEFLLFLYQEDITQEQLFSGIKTKLTFIFQ
ncbi:TetR/AcrR family transcriptional regulator [Bacillus sp. 2205SS5-2]|uniref:TetR/AcrR family transcriptional regulator n=1 Tax=Bacillus sp. 2205SS5-2 TaxID=3109031 RepID=UPI003005F8DD